MEMTEHSALVMRNLSISFDGMQAVSGLSLDVSAGRVTALIGPNGAGKTTLFNLVCGYLRTNSGIIIVAGKIATGKRPDHIARMGVGRSFQDCKVFEQLSVLDNVLLGMRDPRSETMFAALLHRRTLRAGEGKRTKRAVELLQEAGLETKVESLACDLSFGQRKLLELSRVRAFEPSIYLLDEPFSGLFPDMAKRMTEIIRALRNSGKTIIFIEHDMGTVADIADRVVVLNFGRKIADGTPGDIFNDPIVLDAYLGRVGHDAP